MKPKYRGSCPDIRLLAISAAVACLFVLAIATPFITSCTSEEEPAAKVLKPVPAAPAKPPEPPKPPPKPAAPTPPVVEEPQEPEPEPVKVIEVGKEIKKETDEKGSRYLRVDVTNLIAETIRVRTKFIFYKDIMVDGEHTAGEPCRESDKPWVSKPVKIGPGETKLVELVLPPEGPEGDFHYELLGVEILGEEPEGASTTSASPPTALEAGGSAP